MFSSSNIITLLPSEVKGYHSSSFEVSLEQGNVYERDIARFLASQGILCWNKEQYYKPYSQDARRTQEDATILNGVNGVEMVLDIKARPDVFKYSTIGIGEVKKYSQRCYITRAIIVIDSLTHEIAVTDYNPSQWFIEDFGYGDSYSVPRNLFYPLSDLCKRLQSEGYILDDLEYTEDVLDVLRADAAAERYLAETGDYPGEYWASRGICKAL